MNIYNFLQICKTKEVEANIKITSEIIIINFYMKRGILQDHETIAFPFFSGEISSQINGALENKIGKTLKNLEDKMCNHLRVNKQIFNLGKEIKI